MRISDWSSDVCSSDLDAIAVLAGAGLRDEIDIIDFLRAIAIHKVKVRAANALNSGNVEFHWTGFAFYRRSAPLDRQLERLGCIMYPEGHGIGGRSMHRSEEHTSELQSLMRISYAVFCLKKKNTKNI